MSAVIFRAPCVNLVKPEAPVAIDAEACTGCKKCITSIGCPAIGFDVHGAREAGARDAAIESEGRAADEARIPSVAVRGVRKRSGVATVDPMLCTGCGLCTQVCPFDCIKPHV